MSAVFRALLNLGITASWLILAVLLARLLLKKAPKRLVCLFWALVAVRLCCPFSVESSLSLVPKTVWVEEAAVYEAQSTPPTVSAVDADAIKDAYPDAVVSVTVQQPEVTIRKRLSPAGVLPCLWLAGMLAMLGYALVGYGKLRKSVAASVPMGENVLACDEVQSPFILGIVKPKIYVPSFLTGETFRFVITHEKTHIRRQDHWWKPLGYLLLCVYWFHPLVWLSYLLFCRDMELACDEKVVRDMDGRSRAGYSQALLDCAVPRRKIAVCPLAFGEVGVKARVKNVLRCRKPAFWVSALAVLLCVLVGVCFLTSRRDREPDLSLLNYHNAMTVAAQSETVQAIYCPPAENASVSYLSIGSAEGRKLANYLNGADWKERSAPVRSPASPGSVEFILNDDYRVTVYQKPRMARVTVAEKTRYYRTGRSDYAGAAALFKADGGQQPASLSETERKRMTLSQLLALTDGAWTCEDGKISVAFAMNEDRSITGVIQKDGKTVDLSLSYRNIKGSDRRAVFTLYNSAYGQNMEHRLCEGRMQAQRGSIVFTLDKDGEAYFGRKKLSFTFSETEKSASAPEKWFDFFDGDDVLWDEVRITTLPEFPGVTFRCSSEALEVVADGETVTLYYGMPIMSVYFCDLNGDGLRELCSTVSYGSGIIDERIYVADYANNAVHELSDRFHYNYRVSLKDGRAWAEKYPAYIDGSSDELVPEAGVLTIQKVVGDGEALVPTLMLVKSSFPEDALIEADRMLIDRAWPEAEKFAEANQLTLDPDSAKVFRYTGGLSADVVFSEADGDRSVSVSFTVTEDGSWQLLPANAVQLIERR